MVEGKESLQDRLWRYQWSIAGLVGLVLLGLGLYLAYVYRDEGETANFSSIWGLWVSLVGFAITIFTMWETQRVTREAQYKIEAAAAAAEDSIKQTQEETKKILNRTRHEVRHADYHAIDKRSRDLRVATRNRDWHRAIFLVEECPLLVLRLSGAEGLLPEEIVALKDGADELDMIREFILKRLSGVDGDLEPQSAKALNDLIKTLEHLEARLFHESWKG